MALSLNSLQEDFKNEMGGGMYIPKIVEGTIVDVFDVKEGIRGTQQLNTLEVTPVWVNDPGADDDTNNQISNSNVTPFSDEGRSDVTLSAVTLNVGTEFFQAPINPYQFDRSFLRETGSHYDPQLKAVNDLKAAAIKQGRRKLTQGFFQGIGAGTGSTNGFEDIVPHTVTGLADETAANIIGNLGTMHAEIAASAIGGDPDQIIVVNAGDYVLYRQALRAAGLNDVLETRASETGLMMSQFVDDPRVTIIGDAIASERPTWTSKDNIVVASSRLMDHEDPELFYDKTFNAWYLRAFVSLGVQAYQSGAAGLVYQAAT